MPQATPVLPRYSDLVASGKCQVAYATLTAPVIFSTAAGTGGPLVYNGTSGSTALKVHVLAIGFATSVVTTVAGGMGIAMGTSTAPSGPTTIDKIGNCLAGGAATAMTVARVATVSAAATTFFPLAQFHTGALTVDTSGFSWTDIGGLFVAGPGTFVSPAATATLTTLQVQVGLIWAEL